ncbi:MAG: hypothetical protein ACXWYD_17360 [Candidatus Binatia bacterium]
MPGPHADLLGQRGGLANKRIRARKLIGRLITDESSVLADPSFRYAEFIGDDELMQIFLIADPSYLIASLTIREKPDVHHQPLIAILN